jgi:PAS domain S-box-containing protein
MRTLVVVDAAGRIAWSSAAARSVLGLDAEPTLRATLDSMSGCPEVVDEALRMLDAHVSVRPERVVTTASGCAVTIRALASEGRSAGIVLAARTESVEAIAGDVSDPAVSCADRLGRVTWWDGRARRLFGWSSDEMLGRVGLLITVPEESIDHVSIVSVAARQGHEREWTSLLKRKDGTRFEAAIFTRPLLDRHGDVSGVMGLTRLV